MPDMTPLGGFLHCNINGKLMFIKPGSHMIASGAKIVENYDLRPLPSLHPNGGKNLLAVLVTIAIFSILATEIEKISK